VVLVRAAVEAKPTTIWFVVAVLAISSAEVGSPRVLLQMKEPAAPMFAAKTAERAMGRLRFAVLAPTEVVTLATDPEHVTTLPRRM
jgi:hypothetical protein